ncbi:MAG: CehA/McbA family metallohydrolase [Myxococcota bacterium]
MARRALALLLVALGGACSRPPVGPTEVATAARIREASELLWGPAAVGAIGDVRMTNGRMMVVIASTDRAVGFAASGGNIIDVAPLPEGEDHLNQIFLFLADDFPRQARYTKLEIIDAGGSRPAIVRASGLDDKNPKISIETDYILAPGERVLTLTTRFTSSSTATIPHYAMGDAVQWGRAEHLAPGIGFQLSGRKKDLPWIAGLGPGTSYAFVAPRGATFSGPNGAMWSDPIGQIEDLPPKKPVAYSRHLVVGSGDTASMMPAIARLRQEPTGRIEGSVTTGPEGAPVQDATVRILDTKGALVGLAAVGAKGWYSIELPPGTYAVEAIAPGRRPAHAEGEASFQLEAGATVSRVMNLGPPAILAWRVEGEDGRAPPVKVTIVGRAGTADPRLGPAFAASGAGTVVLSPRGFGEAAVGVGSYEIYISQGPELELIHDTVDLAEGERREIRGKLRRTVHTEGFIAADLHQHAVPSFDSGVSLPDRALSNAAEGVEVLVSTDHNVLIDFQPTIAAGGLGRVLATVIGTEATTHSVGHFNGFPLNLKRDDPRGGMVDPEGMTPREIFELLQAMAPGIQPFLQVNHPRAGFIGYFDLMKLNPARGEAQDPRWRTDFNGLEVVQFGFNEETDQVLEDWFSLLRRGVRPTATGNSDSHTITGREVGWARTMVCLPDDNPTRLDVKAFTAALHRGCATVSGGPFLTIRTGTVAMGGLIHPRKGRFQLHVHAEAPSWISTNRLRVYADGLVVHDAPIAATGPVRVDAEIPLSCAQDCFVLARVDGDTELTPILSAADKRHPLPIAITNPIFVDADGDGTYSRGHP